MQIVDSRDLEISEYHPSPALMESVDADDLYAMVSNARPQPSSNTPLTTRFHQVALVCNTFSS